MEEQVQSQQSTQVPAPMGTPVMPMTPPQKSSMSGIVGTIIIIALIILGGLYFWGKRINNQKDTASLMNQEEMASQEASVIQSVSDNDDTASIEAELSATQTSGLGTELQ